MAQVSDAEGVRAALQSVLDETAARLLRSKSKDLALLQSPLSMVSGVSWLPLANHVFTGVLHCNNVSHLGSSCCNVKLD